MGTFCVQLANAEQITINAASVLCIIRHAEMDRSIIYSNSESGRYWVAHEPYAEVVAKWNAALAGPPTQEVVAAALALAVARGDHAEAVCAAVGEELAHAQCFIESWSEELPLASVEIIENIEAAMVRLPHGAKTYQLAKAFADSYVGDPASPQTTASLAAYRDHIGSE